MAASAVNEEARLWNKYYRGQNAHTYHDRHWLWEIFPELFPVPPGKTLRDCYCNTFCCLQCGEIDMEPLKNSEINENICPHAPIYASYFDPNTPTEERRGLTVKAPERDFSREKITVLEVGSGAGATVSPLAEKNAEVQITCGDFCEKANELLRNRPHFDSSAIRVIDNLDCLELREVLSNYVACQDDENATCSASYTEKQPEKENEEEENVLDETSGEGSAQNPIDEPKATETHENSIKAEKTINSKENPQETFDYVIAMFLLSALPPEKVELAVENLVGCVRPGGTLLIYDYAVGDFKEDKFCKTAIETQWGLHSRRGGAETGVTFFNDAFIKFLREKYNIAEMQTLHSNKVNRKTGEAWTKSHILVKIVK